MLVECRVLLLALAKVRAGFINLPKCFFEHMRNMRAALTAYTVCNNAAIHRRQGSAWHIWRCLYGWVCMGGQERRHLPEGLRSRDTQATGLGMGNLALCMWLAVEYLYKAVAHERRARKQKAPLPCMLHIDRGDVGQAV